MKKVIPFCFILFFTLILLEGFKVGIGIISMPLAGFWLLLVGIGGILTALYLFFRKEVKQYPEGQFNRLSFLHILFMCLVFILTFMLINVYVAICTTLFVGYLPIIKEYIKKGKYYGK